MSILSRFSDIISANINSMLDKMEDPSKMIDQYLRDLTNSLAQVKEETAGVMAEEARCKRLVDRNDDEVQKYTDLAKKALQAGNEGDAKIFIAKKQALESSGAGLQTAYVTAHENAEKMRQMHDKLVADIETLNARREMIKAKVAVAKTQEKVNKIGTASKSAEGAMSAFERMEAKADNMLDRANAMSELNSKPIDEAKALEAKYSAVGSVASVNEELEELKKQLGME